MATATDVVAPYWQVFEPPMIDKSTTEFEYVEYQQRDANQMDKADGGQYTIETRDMDAYLLPHKAVLEVRGRLTKADGSGDYTDQEITLTNGGWSLFRSGKYEMNNHSVEEINEYLSQESTGCRIVMTMAEAVPQICFGIRIQERRALVLGNTQMYPWQR